MRYIILLSLVKVEQQHFVLLDVKLCLSRTVKFHNLFYSTELVPIEEKQSQNSPIEYDIYGVLLRS